MICDTLVLLEHNPVITFGRRGKQENILASEKTLEKEKISIYETDRGGDVTYHGRGQLVGYLIFDLKEHGRDITEFIIKIQETFIKLLKNSYNIDSYRDDGVYTGVWTDCNKITAIGVSVSHWITMHGFAFNINTNLNYVKWINPCGITDKGVTSLEKITGIKQDFREVTNNFVNYFCEVFGMKPVFIQKEELFALSGMI